MLYRFPLPDCKLDELEFTLNANAEECTQPTLPEGCKKDEGGRPAHLQPNLERDRPRRRSRLLLHAGRPAVQAISGRQGENGPLLRLRPAAAELKPKQGQAVRRTMRSSCSTRR